MRRPRLLLYVALALARAGARAGARQLGGPGSGSSSLDASASLDSCGLFENQIVCKIDASFNAVDGATSYTASVTAPNGAVSDYGTVGAGGASLWVPYVGNGTYTVEVQAWGTPPSKDKKPPLLATDKASAGKDKGSGQGGPADGATGATGTSGTTGVTGTHGHDRHDGHHRCHRADRDLRSDRHHQRAARAVPAPSDARAHRPHRPDRILGVHRGNHLRHPSGHGRPRVPGRGARQHHASVHAVWNDLRRLTRWGSSTSSSAAVSARAPSRRGRRRPQRQTPIATPQPAPGAPNVPPGGVAVTMTPELMQQMSGLQQLMTTHQVNLQSQPMEVRQAVASDLQAKGINAQVGGALQITDPQQIQDVVQVLKDHGLLPPDVTVN